MEWLDHHQMDDDGGCVVHPQAKDRASLPAEAVARKHVPIATGVLDYFPDALVAVAEVSYMGNLQHNPGQPLHWDRSKSRDEADCMIRHYLQRGTRDIDGTRHTAKMVWRALALLQKEIEGEREHDREVSGPYLR